MRAKTVILLAVAAGLLNPLASWAAEPAQSTGAPAVKSASSSSQAASRAGQEKKTKKKRSRVDFVVTALPASLLVDAEGDKFSVNGNRMSNVYMMPNIAAGAGIELGDFYVDLLGGAGIIVNDAFQSFLLQAVVSATYAFTESFSMGPRAGIVYLTDPDFTDDDSVDFDEALGYLIGLQFSMGDRIQYVVSVDLLTISMDATTEEGSTASDDSLDIAGLAFQFGVRGEF